MTMSADEQYATMMAGLRAIAAALDSLVVAETAISNYPVGASANGVLRGLATARYEIAAALETEASNTPAFRASVERERLRQRAARLESEMNKEIAAAKHSRGNKKRSHEAKAEELRAAWQATLAAL